MSIQGQIDRIRGNVYSAYSAVASKGGTIPAAKNSTNLAAAVQSIPAGGDGLYFESLTMSNPSKSTYYTNEPISTSGTNPVLLLNDGSRVYQTSENSIYTPANGEPAKPSMTELQLTSTINGITLSTSKPINVSTKSVGVVGVVWDYSQSSSALTRLTPETDPYHYVTQEITKEPVSGVSSPFDDILPWADMDEYNIINNAVSYKRGDANFSRSTYDTVVYIPEFYYAVKDDPANSKRYWYISKLSRSGFSKHPGSNRYIGKYYTSTNYDVKSGKSCLKNTAMATLRTNAKSKLGSKWYPYSYDSHCALALLYLVEFANFNVQAKIGSGANIYGGVTGATNSLTYHTGNTGGHVMYRWVEGLWSAGRVPVDGFRVNTAGLCYVCISPSSFSDASSSGYSSTGVSIAQFLGNIKLLAYSSSYPWTFIPNTSTTSSSINNYVTDFMYSQYSSSGNRANRVSRPSATNGYNGFFYFDTYGNFTPYDASEEIYRLMYVP